MDLAGLAGRLEPGEPIDIDDARVQHDALHLVPLDHRQKRLEVTEDHIAADPKATLVRIVVDEPKDAQRHLVAERLPNGGQARASRPVDEAPLPLGPATLPLSGGLQPLSIVRFIA